MIKKADIVLAVALIVLSAVFITATALSDKDGKKVVISVNNQAVAELPLDIDATKIIDNEYGCNTVVIENGKVYVVDADCPDGYCENHVAIKSAGETIACLPHRLVVEIRE